MKYDVVAFWCPAHLVPRGKQHLEYCYEELAKIVQEAIDKGWKPSGSIVVTYKESTFLAGKISDDSLHYEDDSMYTVTQPMVYED